MAKPALLDLTSGQQAWDTRINDNYAKLRDNPMPVPSVANFAALPAAASYDECVISTADNNAYWVSDGVYWLHLGSGAEQSWGSRTVLNTPLSTTGGGLSGPTQQFTSKFPTNVYRVGITLRVTVLITGATTFDVGDGTDVDRYGAAIALAAGTTLDFSDATADPSSGGWNAAAGNVVLTANGSNFTGGEVRCCAHYMSVIPAQI